MHKERLAREKRINYVSTFTILLLLLFVVSIIEVITIWDHNMTHEVSAVLPSVSSL